MRYGIDTENAHFREIDKKHLVELRKLYCEGIMEQERKRFINMNLWKYFLENDGNKITRWTHYFPIYEKHFERFRNSKDIRNWCFEWWFSNVAEIFWHFQR